MSSEHDSMVFHRGLTDALLGGAASAEGGYEATIRRRSMTISGSDSSKM